MIAEYLKPPNTQRNTCAGPPHSALYWLPFFHSCDSSRQRGSEAEPTCAGNDDVHLSDYFVEFHQPEAIHATVG